MGLIICQQHGRQHIQLVCEHLIQNIQQNELGQIFKMRSHTIICEECHSKVQDIANLTIEEILEMREEEFKLFELKASQINEKPICVKCAKDAGILI